MLHVIFPLKSFLHFHIIINPDGVIIGCGTERVLALLSAGGNSRRIRGQFLRETDTMAAADRADNALCKRRHFPPTGSRIAVSNLGFFSRKSRRPISARTCLRNLGYLLLKYESDVNKCPDIFSKYLFDTKTRAEWNLPQSNWTCASLVSKCREKWGSYDFIKFE